VQTLRHRRAPLSGVATAPITVHMEAAAADRIGSLALRIGAEHENLPDVDGAAELRDLAQPTRVRRIGGLRRRIGRAGEQDAVGVEDSSRPAERDFAMRTGAVSHAECDTLRELSTALREHAVAANRHFASVDGIAVRSTESHTGRAEVRAAVINGGGTAHLELTEAPGCRHPSQWRSDARRAACRCHANRAAVGPRGAGTTSPVRG